MIPRLLVITDWALGEARLFAQLRAALAAKVPLAIQHRNPGVTTGIYFEQAVRLKALGAPLFVSARLDVALALETHLHLPAWALPPREVRAALPAGRWLSVAVHDEGEAANAAGADFALVSPVFATASKPGVVPLGAEGFARLSHLLSCPAWALGGIDAARLAQLPGLGGAAVISAVLHAPDATAATQALGAALG